MGEWELSSQNGNLPFKTGELETQLRDIMKRRDIFANIKIKVSHLTLSKSQ